METSATKCSGEKKANMNTKCNGEKKANMNAKCSGEKKEKMPIGKCGQGKCGG
ncbi:MAG: hypothetical protein IE886_03935 [Campylobacterales bacterium]|nr:hypothetical protein [Campylobacterales bacterium]